MLRRLRPSFSVLKRTGLWLTGFLVAASVLVLVVWAIPLWLTQQSALVLQR